MVLFETLSNVCKYRKKTTLRYAFAPDDIADIIVFVCASNKCHCGVEVCPLLPQNANKTRI